ncbi:MAG: hypothetical protein IAG10_22210 [Planctomycetaceae bacterium]|nr:hypothetical protein [Planctomycetaceae bacterium]
MQELQDDIEQLYDNWFIETSDDWVVPYIGDLVGFRRTSAAGEPADAVTDRGRLLNRFLYPRREIANLVRRRRRKGTLSVLEDMAKDVSGWPARAVEFSRLVNFFQNVKHPQPTMGRTFSIREKETHPRVNTPFDRVAHTVDVRQIQNLPGIGWYHPRHLGLFVWRRKAFSATKVCPCRVCKTIACPPSGKQSRNVQYYTFNRIGTESPLAVKPVAEQDELHIADEANLPGLLYRHLLAGENSRARDAYYGMGDEVPKSLAIYARWPGDTSVQLIPGPQVHVCDLTDARLIAFAQNLPSRDVAVDPERGILLFGCKSPPIEVQASYHYAAAMELGGGEYERPVIEPPDFKTIRVRANGCCQGSGPPNLFELVHKTLGQTPEQRCSGRSSDATNLLTRSDKDGPPCTDQCVATWHLHDDLCVELTESDTFCVPANERLQIAKGKTLVIRSALGAWPMLNVQPVDAHSCHLPWRILMEPGSKLVIDGLLIGGVTIEIANAGTPITPVGKASIPAVSCRPCDATNDGSSSQSAEAVQVHLRHTTLVPGGRPHSCANSVHASLNMKVSLAKLVIRHSIVGTLNVEHPRCAKSCGQEAKEPICPLDPLAIEITDSIVDAAYRLPAIYSNCCSPAHADLTIERSTILGDICVQQMSRAEDSLFAGIVLVQRRGVGYLRFCYVPADPKTAALVRPHHRCFENHRSDDQRRLLFDLDQLSSLSVGSSTFEQTQSDQCSNIRTPPRFKCVPEPVPSTDKPACSTGCGSVTTTPSEPAMTVLLPKFVGTEYGQPGYGELSLDCDRRILRGAEDESEVGVFHDLYRPQRDAALRARLQEYTPAEMQSAVLYADDLHPAKFSTHSTNQP